jgi:hypothetical protein
MELPKSNHRNCLICQHILPVAATASQDLNHWQVKVKVPDIKIGKEVTKYGDLGEIKNTM